MKKIASLVLVLIVLTLSSTFCVNAEKIGDCDWNYSGTTLTISGNGFTNEAFIESPEWQDTVTEVIIKNGVTGIGEYAFYECKNLKKVTIPETVNVIGHDAFNGCESLEEINIPSGLKTLEY